MDVAVNKSAKAFMKWKVAYRTNSAQLEGVADIDDISIEPVDLTMAVIKEVSASWLVEMWDYISANPQFTVNGFLCAGISKPLDEDNTDTEVTDNTTDTSDEDETDDACVDYIVL